MQHAAALVPLLLTALATLTLTLTLSSSAAALERPGRALVEHPDAAAELALAAAESALAAAPELAGESGAHRALAALAPLPSSLPRAQTFRRARLEALALLRLGRVADAAVPLRAARAASSTGSLDAALERSAGLAEAAAGDCRAALRAFRRAGAAHAFVSSVSVEAQARCQLSLGERSRALATLDAGIDTIAAALELRTLRARVLVEDGLHSAAAGDDALALAGAASADALAELGGEWLTAAPAVARVVVDGGLARFPGDARFPALAARLDQRSAPRASSTSALRAALLDPTHSADAVELLRATGAFASAGRVAASADDSEARRLRQRLALAVDGAAWDRAVALEPRLRRAGLLDDDAVAYALAWSHHQTGDDAAAGRLLDVIDDATWFERATQLRALMAQRGEP